MTHLLIKNGNIVDGTGKAVYQADILIEEGKIKKIGNLNISVDKIIDATGLYVAPGFIDPHSHVDLSIFAHPTNEAYLMQGVTTQICGNCGLAPAPIGKEIWEFLCWEYEAINKINMDNFSFYQWQMPADEMKKAIKETFSIDVDWNNMEDFFNKMEKMGFSTNIYPQSGHNHIRNYVMGKEYRKATEDELEKMKKILEEELIAGSNGLSTGLDYLPGRFADYDEIKQLLQVVAKYNGCYSTHIRGVDPKNPDIENHVYGVREAIQLCRETKVPTNISHMYTLFEYTPMDNELMKKAATEASVYELEAGKREGLPVTYDVVASQSSGGSTIPFLIGNLRPWVLESGSVERFLENLHDKDYVNKIYYEADEKWPLITNKFIGHGWDMIITSCIESKYVGLKMSDIVKDMYEGDSIRAFLDIVSIDPYTKEDFTVSYGEESVKRLLQSDVSMPCSDGFAFDMDSQMDYPEPLNRLPHPNNYCYAIRQLLYYGSGTIESKVQQMTSRVAKTFRIHDRGEIKEGYWADITIFDYNKLKTNEDKQFPDNKPEGIEYVIVNGEITIQHQKHTGAKAGAFIKRK